MYRQGDEILGWNQKRGIAKKVIFKPSGKECFRDSTEGYPKAFVKKPIFPFCPAILLLVGLMAIFSSCTTIRSIGNSPHQTATPVNENPSQSGTAIADINPNDLITTGKGNTLPDPFKSMYIDSLAARATGGGTLENLDLMESYPGRFSRYFFRFPSEGMKMYGFIDIPDGDGPFPVIILLHGDVSRKNYSVVTYTARYADSLADNGYIVIHPNLRGYPPSPNAENSLGIGDTVDTLNLLSIVRQQAGSTGLLQKADAAQIGLFGHSMGGGIVMRVLIIDHDIKAGLLYASINADEALNLAHFNDDGRGYKKIQVPADSLARISPLNYLNRINAPVFIVHGDQDEVVPIQWSETLYKRLMRLGKHVTYKIYKGETHTFREKGDVQFMKDANNFFDQYLKP